MPYRTVLLDNGVSFTTDDLLTICSWYGPEHVMEYELLADASCFGLRREKCLCNRDRLFSSKGLTNGA
jgi:hypothetical protein